MPIEHDGVIFNKASIIERSLRRMREEYLKDKTLSSYTFIDAMVLNIERACQAVIDLSSHIVAQEHLGVPQNSGESFLMLERAGFISEKSARSMVAMTGFRNVAIHEYQELEVEILRAIAEKEYLSIIEFCRELGLKIVIKEFM